MKVKSESEVTQLCLTLLDPMDFSLPGSSIHGIFQARVLEWGAIAFSEWVKYAERNIGKSQSQEPRLYPYYFNIFSLFFFLFSCQFDFLKDPKVITEI